MGAAQCMSFHRLAIILASPLLPQSVLSTFT